MGTIQRTVDIFGELKYHTTGDGGYWFGLVQNISPYNEIELNIEVDNSDQDLTEKIGLIKSFKKDYNEIMTLIFDYVYLKYKDTESSRTITELKQMYFLVGVNLKRDNKTWWLVLEPGNVSSKDDFFIRLTMVDKKIIWSNLT